MRDEAVLGVGDVLELAVEVEDDELDVLRARDILEFLRDVLDRERLTAAGLAVDEEVAGLLAAQRGGKDVRDERHLFVAVLDLVRHVGVLQDGLVGEEGILAQEFLE